MKSTWNRAEDYANAARKIATDKNDNFAAVLRSVFMAIWAIPRELALLNNTLREHFELPDEDQ